jgi:hypothetical protein
VARGARHRALDALLHGLRRPAADRETEITGPVAAKLFVSPETRDADLFLIVRVFTPDMKEVTFQGALDPHTPVAQGWLRASHRKLDRALTKPYRPYHTHDEVWGRDYEYPGGPSTGLGTLGAVFTGVGPFKHDDARDRPADVFGKRVTLHCGPSRPSHLLLPVIPAKRGWP